MKRVLDGTKIQARAMFLYKANPGPESARTRFYSSNGNANLSNITSLLNSCRMKQEAS